MIEMSLAQLLIINGAESLGELEAKRDKAAM
jgi:hypothetical protein